MKTLSLCLILVASASAIANAANRNNKYDDIYLECIDYGHRPVTPEKDARCSGLARAEVLKDRKINSAYLSCIDYGHHEVSDSDSVACLRYASSY